MPHMKNPDNEPEESAQEPSTRKPPGVSWSGLIDQRIRAAQERGDFDNLPGAGQPLKIDENPYAGSRAMAYSLLKANNVAPPEVELGKEIDEGLARCDKLVIHLRNRCQVLLSQRHLTPQHIQAYNTLLAQTAARYEIDLRELRGKILTLNIIAPAPMHRRLIDVTAKMQAFHEEFPPLTDRDAR